MPIYERISALVSLTLLGLVACFLIELPSRTIELALWGSSLTVVVSQWWLIALLLGLKEAAIPQEEAPPVIYPFYRRDYGPRCPNPRCVSVQDTEIKYLRPEYKIVNLKPLTMRCTYCEHGFEPQYVASSEWHDGTLESKKYHRADSHWTGKIRPENLLIFDSEENAQKHGFKPSRYAR